MQIESAGEEVWANVSDGAVSHLVLAGQLLTTQAAKCGYDPDGDSWMLTEGDAPRPTSGKWPATVSVAESPASLRL
jgi:hypothetical protein